MLLVTPPFRRFKTYGDNIIPYSRNNRPSIHDKTNTFSFSSPASSNAENASADRTSAHCSKFETSQLALEIEIPVLN